MDQVVIEFLKYGVVGLVASLFFYLYMQERKDHDKTRQALYDVLNARLEDSKKTMENITIPLSGISQGIQNISAKIEASKGNN